MVSPFGLHYAHLTPTNTGHVILFIRVVSLDVFQIHLFLNIFFLSFWCCRSSHIVSSKVKIQTPGSFLSQMMNQGRASPSGVTSQLHSRSHVNAAEETSHVKRLIVIQSLLVIAGPICPAYTGRPIHRHTHACKEIFMSEHAHIHTYMYTCMHTCARTYVHVYIYKQVDR